MTLRIHSILIAAFTSAGLCTGAIAQTDHSSHAAPAAKPALASADSAMGDGLVKKIDKGGKRVTIAHGALPNGMPAMTMAYRVKDPAWLDSMKEGQKIRFATDPADGGMTLLRFEAVK
jgi:Cu/Ag efflux protein CusF